MSSIKYSVPGIPLALTTRYFRVQKPSVAREHYLDFVPSCCSIDAAYFRRALA